MNIEECLEYYEDTGNDTYQIYDHVVDGEWYIMEVSGNMDYVITNVDGGSEITGELLTELEESDEWCCR
jgi:hypothetical protein